MENSSTSTLQEPLDFQKQPLSHLHGKIPWKAIIACANHAKLVHYYTLKQTCEVFSLHHVILSNYKIVIMAKLRYLYIAQCKYGLKNNKILMYFSSMVFMASGVHYLGSLRPSDVIYCPMPLYHSAGGCITMGQAFIFGCTIALRTKFSASRYFPDCIKYNATVSESLEKVHDALCERCDAEKSKLYVRMVSDR